VAAQRRGLLHDDDGHLHRRGGLVVGSAGVVGSVCRALWLAARTRGAVAALAPVAAPGELTRVVMRLGLGEVCCVAGARRAAFCAGIIRPRVYLTLAMAEAPPDELAAVLAHEAAHLPVGTRCAVR